MGEAGLSRGCWQGPAHTRPRERARASGKGREEKQAEHSRSLTYWRLLEVCACACGGEGVGGGGPGEGATRRCGGIAQQQRQIGWRCRVGRSGGGLSRGSWRGDLPGHAGRGSTCRTCR
jgi:hypothetical protein